MKKYIFILTFLLLVIGATKIFAGCNVSCPEIGPSRGLCSKKCEFGTCTTDKEGYPFCAQTSICFADYSSGSDYCKYSSYFYWYYGSYTCRFGSDACDSYRSAQQSDSGACTTAKDCAGCTSSKPDYPTYTCDRTKQQCNIVKKCGVSECKTGADCCPIGQKNPHTACGTTVGEESRPYWCTISYTCGKDECDTKDNKIRDTAVWTYWENKKCQVFSCDTKKGQCVQDLLGKYNGLDDHKKCAASCTTTTTKKPTPSTTLKPTTTTSRSTTTTTLKTTTTTLRTTPPVTPVPPATTTTTSGYSPLSCYIYDYTISPNTLGVASPVTKNFIGIWNASGCDTCKMSVLVVDSRGNTKKDKDGNPIAWRSLGSVPIYAWKSDEYAIDKGNREAGYYLYKLTCEGGGETFEAIAKAKILPFYIWYEVPPMFPSRFKNIESSPN